MVVAAAKTAVFLENWIIWIRPLKGKAVEWRSLPNRKFKASGGIATRSNLTYCFYLYFIQNSSDGEFARRKVFRAGLAFSRPRILNSRIASGVIVRAGGRAGVKRARRAYALFFSAIPTSSRKIALAPLSRSLARA
jgi:hypothetical protein